WVKCIANKVNTGFSKANNQAMLESVGEYVLLLNPDTVVEEDTFSKCISFMDSHPDAGGLGVQMIDGKGNFLPESKRGLPSPSVAFYKIFGLSALFPRSRVFGKYHLGYLDKNKTHEVDVLSGAFMLMRKTTLDKIGLLDETFFMYGEDIDLSYRIIKGGYKNYYFADTRIIHYKGESTKKSSVNYVIVFYKAMIIFAAKHFSQSNAKLFSFFINIAIYLRAGIAILNRFVKKMALPVADGIMFFAGMFFLKMYWESSVKELHYPPVFMWLVVPGYILIWLYSVYLNGGYDKPIRISRTVRGIISGTVFILVVYALLSEEYRFSRALILLGTAWSSLSASVLRIVLDFAGIKGYRLERNEKKNLVIVAEPEEGRRILSILQFSNSPVSFIGFVAAKDADDEQKVNDYAGYFLGTINNLKEITALYSVSEVIFSAKDISSQEIINQMLYLSQMDVEYKIAPPESLFIIGSNSINDQGDLYLVDVNAITTRSNKRNKRLVDIGASLLFLISSPLLIFKVKNMTGFFSNIFNVLSGNISWVGFIQTGNEIEAKRLRKGVLNPADLLHKAITDTQTANRMNALYARDYKVSKDIRIIFRSIALLGRST
ncbi:MAG TPA: glycosyltransferase, partial [Bacteroidia bacterium]|nr:glycosyltransferase [Bacteroidia bacterium]